MGENRTSVIVLVVVYNKAIRESTTISSILEYGLSNLKLVIHNNGPEVIAIPESICNTFLERGISYELTNCIKNKPLSILYNDFINGNKGYSKYIIFDDDSILTESYIEAINSIDYDLELPRITSRADNLNYYPKSNGIVVNENSFLNTLNTFSIGSGLIITSALIDKFNDNDMDIFDEGYALYGVDFSLFRRLIILSKKGVSFKVKTSSNILHSLSRADGRVSDFRLYEGYLDFAITVRRYPTFRQYLAFTKLIVLSFFKLNFKLVLVLLSTFLYGSHPRCRKWSDC